MINDEKSRELIVTDFTNTLFVDAGAGSGKTTAMVSRILALLLNGKTDIREIVAITFTNEGAASLKSKIQMELEKANSSEVYKLADKCEIKMGTEEKDRIKTALEFLPLAHFSTIHSFSLSILKERPIEASIDPYFSMDVNGPNIDVFEDVWREYILLKSKEENPFWEMVFKEKLDLNTISEFAQNKSAYPDLDIYVEKCKNITDKEIENNFEKISEIIDKMYDHINDLDPETTAYTSKQRRDFVYNLFKKKVDCENSEDKKFFILSVLDMIGELPKTNWKKDQTFFKECTDEIQKPVLAFSKKYYDFIHYEISRFVDTFEKFYDHYKKENSSLDFHDLLLFARNILKDNLEVREYFKRKFKYIFIDETQDTDPLQTEIVFFLSEEKNLNAKDWKEVKLEKSKLFMVGDPKQSIYKFRRADIQIYNKSKDIIQSQGGKILKLNRNFRSNPKIIKMVNDHFGKSFTDYEKEIAAGYQAEYIPLLAATEKPSKFEDHIYSIPISDPKQTQNEVNKIIYFIKQITDDKHLIFDPNLNKMRPIQYRDIMILSKVTYDIGNFARPFEDAGIPLFIVGGKSFFESEEIRGLIFALKAIDDPNDTISLFGALKSPIFAFGDKELFNFVKDHGSLNIFSGKDNKNAIGIILKFLKDLHYQKSRIMPSEILKRLFDETGICHLLLVESNGLQKTSRLYRLLELVYEIESDHTLSFHEIVTQLEGSMEDDELNLANLNISKVGENAVKLSSIHKAKGLEAPVIILMNAYKKEKNSAPNCFVLRDEGKVIIPYNIGGFYIKNPEDLQKIEEARERCEYERLRYVAATRAKDILAICIPEDVEELTFNGKFSKTLSHYKSILGSSPDSVKSGPDKSKQKIDIEECFEKAQKKREEMYKEFRERAGSIKSPFKSVHEVIEIDQSVYKTKRISKGKEYGILIHRIIQQFLSDENFNLESIIDSWIDHENVSKKYRDDIIRTFEKIKTHQLILEAKNSSEKYCEWEFFIKRDGVIIEGLIDLVYKNKNNEWIIVDFKTDDVSDIKRKELLTKEYAKQLDEYKKSFEEITGEKVKNTEIIFVSEL